MLRGLTRIFVRYAERYIPDPYLYALILTFITVGAALIFTPSDPIRIVNAWYEGVFQILAFAMQMALILSTGVALAEAAPVKRALQSLASIPSNQTGAAVTLFLVGGFANLLNWGFGLVVGVLVAREMARRLKDVDFAFLVAIAYMGNMVWASGLSSSIALASATPGSALNIIEKVTGRIAGLNETIFTPFNLVPTLLVFIVLPIVLVAIQPSLAEMKRVDPALLPRSDAPPATEPAEKTFATRLENASIITYALVAMGLAYWVNRIATTGFSLDINGMIFIAFMLGLVFHARPIRYVRAFNAAAKTVGPILLQFPLYGGIMGMMTGTGLANVISEAFVAFSTHATLPFWSFVSSNIISLFVPSGGGHWAVQGPFMVPAAIDLGVSPAFVAMAVAMGEQTANMIQPFWALPVLAIAGLGIKDIMGYCVMALLVGLTLYGGALLIFA